MEHPATLRQEGPKSLCAVIDGMGGYKGGALAARMSAGFLGKSFSDRSEVSKESLQDFFRSLLGKMEKEVERDPSLREMGATLAGLMLCQEAVFVFNCGDCRVYRFRSGYLERLSRDHSLVQELVDQGTLEEDAMRTHPQKNVVTAAVQASAAGEDPTFFLKAFTYVSGDAFFLCSDGVWEALPVESLEECLREEDAAQGCEMLCRRLLETPCRDNITFILLTPSAE